MPLATTSPSPPEAVASRVVLPRISWQTYERLLEEVGDGPFRLTFDRGRLEIELPSVEHERLKKFVGQLIETYALEVGIDFLPLGSATWRREPASGGLEADECYYVANARAVADKAEIDLEVDPPPDLAVEVDLTRSSVDKQGVYARLRIPELWRVHAEGFECLHLTPDGRYAAAARSRAFPELPLDVVAQQLEARPRRGHAPALRAFRDWARREARPKTKPPMRSKGGRGGRPRRGGG